MMPVHSTAPVASQPGKSAGRSKAKATISAEHGADGQLQLHQRDRAVAGAGVSHPQDVQRPEDVGQEGEALAPPEPHPAVQREHRQAAHDHGDAQPTPAVTASARPPRPGSAAPRPRRRWSGSPEMPGEVVWSPTVCSTKPPNRSAPMPEPQQPAPPVQPAQAADAERSQHHRAHQEAQAQVVEGRHALHRHLDQDEVGAPDDPGQEPDPPRPADGRAARPSRDREPSAACATSRPRSARADRRTAATGCDHGDVTQQPRRSTATLAHKNSIAGSVGGESAMLRESCSALPRSRRGGSIDRVVSVLSDLHYTPAQIIIPIYCFYVSYQTVFMIEWTHGTRLSSSTSSPSPRP